MRFHNAPAWTLEETLMASPAHDTASPQETVLIPITTVKVVVVDDDPDICELLSLTLDAPGRSVETFENPRAALKALGQADHHVVVLDLMMPELNGLELLEQLRQLDPDVGVIIHTANASFQSVTAAMKLGAEAYLRKPATPEDFEEAISSILASRGMLARPVKALLTDLGANIRKERKERGMLLKELARRTGISTGALSMIERARNAPSLTVLHRIARGLDVPIVELLGT